MQSSVQIEENALQEFLQQLLHTHKRPTCCFEENGTILYASESFLKLFRCSTHLELQNNFNLSLKNSSKNSLISQFPITLEKGFSQCTLDHTLLNGSQIRLEYGLNLIHHKDKNIIVGVTSKIELSPSDAKMLQKTAHVVAEQNPLITEHALKIIDASPTGISLWSEDFQIIACNTVFLDFFNVESINDYKQVITSLVPEFQPCGTPSVKFGVSALEQAFREGYATLEWFWLDKAGNIVPTMVTLRRITTENEPLVVGYIYDLRELQSIKEIAKDAEERVQIMWDSMPLGATFWNKDLELIDCNLVVAQLFGFDTREGFIQNFYTIHPEYQPNGIKSIDYCKDTLAKVFREGYGEIDWLHITQSGEALPAHITLFRTEYKGEDVVLAYVTDLREIKASRKETSNALTHSKIMFETAPLGITFWNKDLEMLNCNEEILRIFNLNDKDEYLNHILNITPEFQENGQRSDELIWQKLAHAFEVGHHELEWMHQDLEGNPIPMHIVLVRSMLDDEPIVISYAKDLRELKKAEQKISEFEQLNKIIFDAIPVSTNIWDKNFRLLGCNNATLKLFGFENKKEYLQSFYKLHPEIQPNGSISAKLIFEDFRLALKEGYRQIHWMHQKPDGTQFPTEKTFVKATYQGEDIVLIFTRNLSELYSSQNILREVELRNELMLDALPLGIHFWDESRKLIYSNLAGVRLFGFESKEDYLREFLTTLPDFQPDGTKSTERIAKILDKAFEKDYLVTKFTGKNPFNDELIPVEITIIRVCYRGKLGVISYIRDLREMKDTLN